MPFHSPLSSWCANNDVMTFSVSAFFHFASCAQALPAESKPKPSLALLRRFDLAWSRTRELTQAQVQAIAAALVRG